MRVPKRSMSRLATGTMASAMRRASAMSGARPERSMPSRIGTSPERGGSAPAPRSGWSERDGPGQARHFAREGGKRARADLGLAGADEANDFGAAQVTLGMRGKRH